MLALTRRHPISFYAKLALVSLVTLLPLAGMWYLIARYGEIGEDSQQWALVTLSAVWVAYWVFRFALIRYRYQNEAWIITDRRLAHIFRRNWFSGWTNTVEIADIFEVVVRKPKLWGRLFHYGDVQCWHYDGRLIVVIAGVARPEELQAMIQRLHDRLRIKGAR